MSVWEYIFTILHNLQDHESGVGAYADVQPLPYPLPEGEE